MSETIKAEIHSTEALDQLSPQCIMEYLAKRYGGLHHELLESFTDLEMIVAMGGIDQILEDHPEAVQDHVANTNKSDRESAQERF